MRKEYDFGQAKRGSVVPVPKGKTRITIRLDEDVVEWFKQQVHAAGGGNYQTLINAALRKYIDGGHVKKCVNVLRRRPPCRRVVVARRGL